jgi:hypothetical protein
MFAQIKSLIYTLHAWRAPLFASHKGEEVGSYRCKSVRKHEHAIITAATLCVRADALSAELIVFQLSHEARAKIRFSDRQHAILAPAIVFKILLMVLEVQ